MPAKGIPALRKSSFTDPRKPSSVLFRYIDAKVNKNLPFGIWAKVLYTLHWQYFEYIYVQSNRNIVLIVFYARLGVVLLSKHSYHYIPLATFVSSRSNGQMRKCEDILGRRAVSLQPMSVVVFSGRADHLCTWRVVSWPPTTSWRHRDSMT